MPDFGSAFYVLHNLLFISKYFMLVWKKIKEFMNYITVVINIDLMKPQVWYSPQNIFSSDVMTPLL